MKKYLYLVLGILGVINVFDSFFGGDQTDNILWIEVDIWIYRLFWAIISIVLLFDFFQRKKAEKEANEDPV